MTEYFTLPKNDGSNASVNLDIAMIMLADRERVSRCCVCDSVSHNDFASDWFACSICKKSICSSCVDTNDTEDSGLPLRCYECSIEKSKSNYCSVTLYCQKCHQEVKFTLIEGQIPSYKPICPCWSINK